MLAPDVGGPETNQKVEGPHHPAIGRFRVIDVLGQGSFGIVYHAFDPILDREVALKVPRIAEANPQLQERFTREAKSAAKLRHPNIVTVYESGIADGVSYIATEFVKGVTLSEVIRTREVDIRTAVDLVRQVAEALHYAHLEGVVHRDIKPSNIMLNSAGRPQVTDFGLAKRVADEASNMTVEGQVLGTPAYMSPEQARGEMHSVGPLSDQYSVGVVLYELLCRQRMFQGPPWSVMSRIGNPGDSAASPRSIRPEIPRDLEACVLKATDKEASSRYSNLGELAEDLERWLEGRIVLARPVGHWERFRRWARQNPVVTTLASLLVLLLIAATIVSIVAAVRFRELARSESESKSNLERVLIDTYAESGLAAADRNDASRAVLWFANAVDLARDHPIRREWNAVRLESWLAEAAVPFCAIRRSGYWCEAIEFHPSSRYLLVESLADSCEIYDLPSGEEITLPHNGPIQDAVWNRQGTLLALASTADVIVVTFPDYEPVSRWNHYGAVRALAFSENGEWLAVAGGDTLEICRLNVSPPTEYCKVDTLPIQSMTFSPDGRFIATATDDEHVQAFSVSGDLSSMEPVGPPFPARSEISEAQYGFTADNHLVVADTNVSVACWNLGEMTRVWDNPTERILDLSVSFDRERVAYSELVTGGSTHAVVLQGHDGSEVSNSTIHQDQILSVNWHPSGEMLLTTSADHTAMVSTLAGKAVLPAIHHCGRVSRGAWSPDGRTLATCLRDEPLVQVWRMPDRSLRAFSVASGREQTYFKVRPADGGEVIVPTGFDNRRSGTEIALHDAATGDIVGAGVTCRGVYNDSEYIPGRDLLITLSSRQESFGSSVIYQQDLNQPGCIQFWSVTTSQPVFHDVETGTEPIGIAVTPRGERAGVICHSGEFWLLDVETGRVVSHVPSPTGQPANHGYVIHDRIRCAPDGSRFATWGFAGQIQFWDATTGRAVLQMEHDGDFVHDLQFSPEADIFASCSEDGTARVWDSDDGTPLATLSHAGWVFCVRFSDDGRYLLTGCEDGQARIWDWRNNVVVVTTPELSDQVYSVCFLPPGKLLAGTRSGELTAWETDTGKLLAPPQQFGHAIYQMDLCNGLLLISGRMPTLYGLNVSDWIRTPAAREPQEMQMIVELVAAQHIPESGTPMGLTTEEWLDRWRKLQESYPQSSLFEFPGGSSFDFAEP